MKIPPENPPSSVEVELESLRPVRPRRTEKAGQGRAAFLAQAHELRQQVPSSPVTPAAAPTGRFTGWPATLLRRFRAPGSGVQRWPLLKPALAMLAALVLVFASAALTASAAQSSLPGEGLYAVKLLTEDLRLSLAPSAQARLELALAFSDRRVNELAGGRPVDPALSAALEARWEQQLDQGMQAAAGLGDGELPAALQQLQAGLQQQERTLQQLGQQAAAAQAAEQARQRLQAYLGLVAAGRQDPQQFRRQWQAMLRQHSRPAPQQTSPQPETPAETEPPGPGATAVEETPQPGGSGPGQTPGRPPAGELHGPTPQPETPGPGTPEPANATRGPDQDTPRPAEGSSEPRQDTLQPGDGSPEPRRAKAAGRGSAARAGACVWDASRCRCCGRLCRPPSAG